MTPQRIFAIDPGSTSSGWLRAEDPDPSGRYPLRVLDCGIADNEELLRGLVTHHWEFEIFALEMVESFGMAVGREVFETVYWSGRFAQAAVPLPCLRIGRKACKLQLCGSARATSANIRQALLDLFGGPSAVGTKKAPGPLYGVKSHAMSALAVAVTCTQRTIATPGWSWPA
jgi:hypothetical protein